MIEPGSIQVCRLCCVCILFCVSGIYCMWYMLGVLYHIVFSNLTYYFMYVCKSACSETLLRVQ